MDQEALELLKKYCNRTPKYQLNNIALEYGTTGKEIRARVRKGLKELITYYEIKEGLA